MSESKVDHPSHYNSGSIEVIDVIEDWGLDFVEGNVIKYLARHRHKGHSLNDLKKAQWYLNRLVSRVENEALRLEKSEIENHHEKAKRQSTNS